MFFISSLIPVMVTMASAIGSMDDLPPGSFGHFGPCVMKFVRLSDKINYVDLTEHLIHANDPANLIYTINSKLKFSNN